MSRDFLIIYRRYANVFAYNVWTFQKLLSFENKQAKKALYPIHNCAHKGTSHDTFYRFPYISKTFRQLLQLMLSVSQ